MRGYRCKYLFELFNVKKIQKQLFRQMSRATVNDCFPISDFYASSCRGIKLECSINNLQQFKGDLNPESTTFNLQQATISNDVVFSIITNKARFFMRLVCWQGILMKYHTFFFVENKERCCKMCCLLQS